MTSRRESCGCHWRITNDITKYDPCISNTVVTSYHHVPHRVLIDLLIESRMLLLVNPPVQDVSEVLLDNVANVRQRPPTVFQVG